MIYHAPRGSGEERHELRTLTRSWFAQLSPSSMNNITEESFGWIKTVGTSRCTR
jgi:hypothetical protein